MAATLRPHRGKKSTATTKELVLKRGEIFFEVPETGVGTGTGKIKMGDGTTPYAELPYYTSTDLSDLTGELANGVTATTQAAGDNSKKVATTAYVDTAVGNLPSPMIFKGSLGTGGTITALPTAAASNEGWTYKVITAGTYASQAADVGDIFISNGTAWILIPSGDEPSGTLTSVKIEATGPIAIDDDSAITTSGVRVLSHANSGVTAGTYKSVTVNATGHITAGTNPTTLAGYGITDAVSNSTTVNGHALSGDVTVTASDVGLGNVGNFKAVSTVASQGLTSTEQSNARANIGAGTSNFSGDFDDLTNTPTTLSGYGITDAMSNTNPTGTGSLSLNRKAGATVGTNSVAIGTNNMAVAEAAVAEGIGTNATGDGAHAEGNTTNAYAPATHAEGYNNSATQPYAHVEGSNNFAHGQSSHAEGDHTTASGPQAHAEGLSTSATNTAAHAEGWTTTASALYAHAEGDNTTASGQSSHAEGSYTKATSSNAHAEGYYSEAKASYSHAEGWGTLANSTAQHVEGKYNIEDTSGKYAHIIGNGGSPDNRSNAMTVDWDGNIVANNLPEVNASEEGVYSLQASVSVVDDETTISYSWGNSGEFTGELADGVTATTQMQGDNSNKVATTAYVDAAVDNLPSPMIFKGSLGTGGTITELPAASTANEGWTYKVITAGTYASQAADVGDIFISNGTAWILIPSGDEPSGTVTSVKIEATGPIAIDDDSAITASGVRTISHANSGVTAGTYKSVTVNATGHITAGTNPTTLSGYGITDAVPNTRTVNGHALSENVTVTASDVGLGNVGNFKAVSTVASQGLNDAEKANARANIGAGTSSFSGDFDDLTNTPTTLSGYGITDAVSNSTTVNGHALSGDVTVTASDVGLGNVGNFKGVSTVASQGLTDAEKSNARANIGAMSNVDATGSGSLSWTGNATFTGAITASNIPAAPTDDGTYLLMVAIADGEPTYSWINFSTT